MRISRHAFRSLQTQAHSPLRRLGPTVAGRRLSHPQIRTGDQWRFYTGAGGAQVPPNRGEAPNLAVTPNCGYSPLQI